MTAIALLLHLLSAHAIGGSYVSYRDHIAGFILIALVPGLIIAGIGWRFWKGRHDITLLVLGVVQVLLGIYVYINRFRVHG
ncbi:MAG: hypothetical protein ABR585_11165 [Gemmatimonadaceae bacterium]